MTTTQSTPVSLFETDDAVIALPHVICAEWTRDDPYATAPNPPPKVLRISFAGEQLYYDIRDPALAAKFLLDFATYHELAFPRAGPGR